MGIFRYIDPKLVQARSNALGRGICWGITALCMSLVTNSIDKEIEKLKEDKKMADIQRKNQLELLKIECRKTIKEFNNLFNIKFLKHHPITSIEHEVAWIVISLKNPQVYSVSWSYQIFDNYESFNNFIEDFVKSYRS